ncbi:MAG TPA: DUF4340 domain-containing protein [Polyangiales bacterium]|nr:DUF4340 domain-containing protein [Polyangiales bacterium]
MKAVLVHGLLAIFGLGLAYQTWTRDPEAEEAPGSVTVAECREGDLQKLKLDTENATVSVEPQRQKDETLYWITVQKKVKPKPKPEAKADGGVAETPAPEPAKPEEEKPKVFLANAAFKDYLKLLTPLKAAQGLGNLPKEKLADFGFDKVDTTIDLSCAGKQLELEAGARTFGTGQRYVRDAKSKSAYLFNDDVVSDLQSAQFKFMQTDLHGFANTDVEEVTVEVRGTKKKLLQRDRKLADKAQWVDASAPAKRNELYGNWFSRVSRVRARDFLPRNAEPGSELKTTGGEITPVLRIDYKVEGKPNAELELVKVEENGTAHYYARTETTRGWVTVYDSTAKEVEQDAAMVVGLEEAPASKTEPKKPEKPSAADPHGMMPGMPHGAMPGMPPGHPPMGAPHGK